MNDMFFKFGYEFPEPHMEKLAIRVKLIGFPENFNVNDWEIDKRVGINNIGYFDEYRYIDNYKKGKLILTHAVRYGEDENDMVKMMILKRK